MTCLVRVGVKLWHFWHKTLKAQLQCVLKCLSISAFKMSFMAFCKPNQNFQIMQGYSSLIYYPLQVTACALFVFFVFVLGFGDFKFSCSLYAFSYASSSSSYPFRNQLLLLTSPLPILLSSSLCLPNNTKSILQDQGNGLCVCKSLGSCHFLVSYCIAVRTGGLFSQPLVLW